MTEEEQIAADLAPGDHEVPESVLTYNPPESTFDESQKFLHGQGSEAQKKLADIQTAQDKIRNWMHTFHGPEPESVGNLRNQVAGGKITGSDYYAMTGRIYAGGTGDVARRDTHGNITGYTSRDGSGSALGGPSDTPGLDAFHEMNSDAASSPGFSFLQDSPAPMPGSVAAHVGAPSPGHAMAVDTLTYDTRLQNPTRDSVQGPKADGTRRNQTQNDRLGDAAWKKGIQNANASVRANFKAAGLPDPSIAATVLQSGGGTSVVTGNMGYQGVPRSVWG